MKAITKYHTTFWVGVSVSMEYRFDFFMNLLSTIFPIVIQVFLWSAIYSGSSEGSMYGYTFVQMVLYACFAGVVSKFVATQVEERINEDIHSGGLNKFLVMPVSYLYFRLIYAFGEKLFSMLVIFVLSVTAAIIIGFSGLYIIQPLQIAGFVLALFGGMVLHFLLFTLISFSAFWLTEVGSFFHAIGVVVMVISGGVFPIEIFGEQFAYYMQYLPFLYTTGFPVKIITGAISGGDILQGIGIQIIWSILFAIAAAWLWSRGIRRYSSVGG